VDVSEPIRVALEARADVALAYRFGSTARGETRASSDVDVAVLFTRVPEGRDLDRLGTELERLARRRIDLVVLNTAPPLLAHEITRTGRILVCHRETERVRFESWVASRYLDTAHLRSVQHGYLKERVAARPNPSC
jgi:predicted nucleotidyltransferase